MGGGSAAKNKLTLSRTGQSSKLEISIVLCFRGPVRRVRRRFLLPYRKDMTLPGLARSPWEKAFSRMLLTSVGFLASAYCHLP